MKLLHLIMPWLGNRKRSKVYCCLWDLGEGGRQNEQQTSKEREHLQENEGERRHKRETQGVVNWSISDSYTGKRRYLWQESTQAALHAEAHTPSPRRPGPQAFPAQAHSFSSLQAWATYGGQRASALPTPTGVQGLEGKKEQQVWEHKMGREPLHPPSCQGCRFQM
jgi:hypothetical protein